jgi:hypothetical protein
VESGTCEGGFTLRDPPLAVLWDAWKSPTGNWVQSFSIITVEANSVMRSIHDRMIDSAGKHTAQNSPTRVASFSYRKQIASAIS